MSVSKLRLDVLNSTSEPIPCPPNPKRDDRVDAIRKEAFSHLPEPDPGFVSSSDDEGLIFRMSPEIFYQRSAKIVPEKSLEANILLSVKSEKDGQKSPVAQASREERICKPPSPIFGRENIPPTIRIVGFTINKKN